VVSALRTTDNTDTHALSLYTRHCRERESVLYARTYMYIIAHYFSTRYGILIISLHPRAQWSHATLHGRVQGPRAGGKAPEAGHASGDSRGPVSRVNGHGAGLRTAAGRLPAMTDRIYPNTPACKLLQIYLSLNKHHNSHLFAALCANLTPAIHSKPILSRLSLFGSHRLNTRALLIER
jgi:hypothetical protein